jgi:peptide/nickel transport system permease protein
MIGYILRRIVSAILVLFVTSTLVFALFLYGPSDPAQALCNVNRCTDARRAQIHHSLGIDQPFLTQYGDWLKGIFVGREISFGSGFNIDCSAPCLGVSYITKEEVTPYLMGRFPATLSISLAGFMYLALGVVIGAFAARRRGTMVDRSLVGSTLVISSIPYYLVALLAYLYLVLKWGIFSDTSYVPLTQNPLTWAGHMALPWAVLTVYSCVTYARFGRGSMIDSLGEDYVRTARAKGLGEAAIVLKHALRSAIVPVITIFGIDIATLLAGTIFTERIFGIQGIGFTALSSLTTGDLPVISATVIIAAAFIIAANLIVDLLYSVLDPRVRLL